MAPFPRSTGHHWALREVRINNQTFFHRRCRVCGRDLARLSEDGEEWRAVHVGGFKFDFLDEKTTLRWVTEGCPGRRLPGEANSERILRGL